MTTKILEDKDFLVPEIEVRISESWINLIQWCKLNIPHGQVCVELNNGEPGNLIHDHTKVKINFGRKSTISSYQPFIKS